MLFAGLCIYKKDSIAKRLERFARYFDKTQPTEAVLRGFNNEPLEVLNGRYGVASGGEKDSATVSMLFIGNSLTYCGVPNEESDKTRRGLTSTSIEKDYVHVLMRMLCEQWNKGIDCSITNIAVFERGFAASTLQSEADLYEQFKTWFADCSVLYAPDGKKQKPDYVIIQIGENMSGADVALEYGEVLKKQYARLLEFFPKSKIVMTLPWWPDKNKINVMTEVAVDAKKSGIDVSLVDISHLGTDSFAGKDSMNFATWQRTSLGLEDYKNPGVGAHPGDIGMKRIAKCLFMVMR